MIDYDLFVKQCLNNFVDVGHYLRRLYRLKQIGEHMKQRMLKDFYRI